MRIIWSKSALFHNPFAGSKSIGHHHRELDGLKAISHGAQWMENSLLEKEWNECETCLNWNGHNLRCAWLSCIRLMCWANIFVAQLLLVYNDKSCNQVNWIVYKLIIIRGRYHRFVVAVVVRVERWKRTHKSYDSFPVCVPLWRRFGMIVIYLCVAYQALTGRYSL